MMAASSATVAALAEVGEWTAPPGFLLLLEAPRPGDGVAGCVRACVWIDGGSD